MKRNLFTTTAHWQADIQTLPGKWGLSTHRFLFSFSVDKHHKHECPCIPSSFTPAFTPKHNSEMVRNTPLFSLVQLSDNVTSPLQLPTCSLLVFEGVGKKALMLCRHHSAIVKISVHFQHCFSLIYKAQHHMSCCEER